MPFPKILVWKVNLIAQLEFELAYYKIAVQHISHYTTGIPKVDDTKTNKFSA